MSGSTGVGFEIERVATSDARGPGHSPHGFDPSVEIDGRGARAITRVSRRLPSGETERQALVWDLSTGFHVPGAWIALHPDGERALRREADGRVTFCDVASGASLCTLDLESPRHVAMSPDSPHAVLSVRDTVPAKASPRIAQVVYDLSTGATLHELSGSFLLEAFVPGGRLLSVDERNVLTLWNLASGRSELVGKGPREQPRVLRLDREGRRAVVVGAKGNLQVWDLAERRIVHEHDALARLRGGPGEHLRLLADGRRLVSEGQFLDVLDLETGALDCSWVARDPNRDRILAVAPLAAGPFVAVLMCRGLFDPNTLEVWDVDRRLRVGLVEVTDAQVLAVAPGGRAVVAGDEGVVSFQLHARAGVALPPQPALAAPKAASRAAAKKAPAKKAPAKKTPAKKAAPKRSR